MTRSPRMMRAWPASPKSGKALRSMPKAANLSFSAAAGLSAQEFADAYLLNLDITEGERSYAFEITDVDVGAETVTVAVKLTRAAISRNPSTARLSSTVRRRLMRLRTPPSSLFRPQPSPTATSLKATPRPQRFRRLTVLLSTPSSRRRSRSADERGVRLRSLKIERFRISFSHYFTFFSALLCVAENEGV